MVKERRGQVCEVESNTGIPLSILWIPDFERQFVVNIDASDVACGGYTASRILDMDYSIQLAFDSRNIK